MTEHTPDDADFLEPTTFAPEPADVEYQDDVPHDGVLAARSFAATSDPTTPRTIEQALAFMQHQAVHPSKSWEARCQELVRTAYGVGPLFGTAYLQWLGAHPDDKHVGGSPDDAPVGALLCSKGSNKAGHIWLAARPFPSGASGSWSNDLVVTGDVDKVRRNAPMTQWRHKFLGYLTAVNHHDIAALHKKPAPKQTKPYAAIATAINNLGVARDTAVAQHDNADVVLLNAEIVRLQKLYNSLRRA